ncbi:hypothetical protein C823_005107 [Eubacterium plexicaudatum ASF492]|uniref:Uncharacterized protein n=1 Tax=Eubacterium plexicaudatum ASF492 TaxID=1235802 RepID=N1ZYA2_9FIRM|nr:hypothetical protein C823_005107 [Eubacterium plexicaudatum ASF492]
MKRKHQIASILLYNFIALTVAIGGWLWEVLIFIVKEQHFVNRGFLYGPYLPVYGFGILWMKWAGPFLIRTWERLRFSVQIPIIGLLDLMLITDVIFSIMQPNSGRNITF